MVLYPSIALSDIYNMSCFFSGAWILLGKALPPVLMQLINKVPGLLVPSLGFNKQEYLGACCGMIIVGLAAMFGVLRFGISEHKFIGANKDVATMAKFVGLPLVGLDFGHSVLYGTPTPVLMVLVQLMCLVLFETVTRSLVSDREGLTVLFNLGLVISPVIYFAHIKNDVITLVAMIVFLIGALGIGDSFEKRIAGIRRVDWFHYIIGSTWFVLACRLISV
jgi:hypothetical protein